MSYQAGSKSPLVLNWQMLIVYYNIASFRFLWPSTGKELTSWLSACAVLHYAALIVCVPFPFAVWGSM